MHWRAWRLLSKNLIACWVGLLLVGLAHGQDTAALPSGHVGENYSTQLKAEGGLGPLTWKLMSGALPPGLQISTAGAINGTPTATSAAPYTFVVEVSDSSQPPQTSTLQFSIAILPAQLHIVGGSNSTNAPPPTKPPQPNCWTAPSKSGICGGPMLRTIVGFEQAGVSGGQSKQDFFLDLLYDRPLGFRVDPDLGPALRSWGDLRISSVPQQINTDVAEFATSFAQQVGQLKVNEVAQSFEFLGGIQYRLYASPRQPNDYAGDDGEPDHRQRMSVNLILGGGVVTPLSPQQSVRVFAVPSNQPDFFTLYPQAAGKQFVAFTLADRHNFYRQAYAGLRLMTHFLGDTKEIRFPETFDLSYGFNEAVTGGTIRGGVFRLEAFVPIPYAKASWLYLFGTGLFKPGGHATISNPFFLDPAPTGTLPTDPNAVVITTAQASRDYYRVGMGIDFITLVQQLTHPSSKGKSHQN
jgi:Putative Ig domain